MANSTAESGEHKTGGGVAGGEAAPWPALFMTTAEGAPTEAMLCALWPSVLALMREKSALLQAHLPVHGGAGAVLMPESQAGGGQPAEYTIWIQHTDERILVLLACAGKRKPSDAAAHILLGALSEGLIPEKLAAGSLRSRHTQALPWWTALLRALRGTG